MVSGRQLKSGLYPGRFTSLSSRPVVLKYSRTASPLLMLAEVGAGVVVPNDFQRPGVPLAACWGYSGRPQMSRELLFTSQLHPLHLPGSPGIAA